MSYSEGPTRTFPNNAALTKGTRVTLSSGNLAAADANTVEFGTMEYRALSTDELGTVRLRNSSGTRLMVANAAISSGGRVYAAASGKVAPTGTLSRGVALEAATADGDVIEVLPDDGTTLFNSATESVAAAGSAQGDATALVAGRLNTVSGADNTKGVVLPAAATLPVLVYNEHASNGLKVYPASGDDINDGTANAAVTIEGKTLAWFIPIDSSTWAATFTANS